MGLTAPGEHSDRFVRARIAGGWVASRLDFLGQLGTRQLLVANAVWDGVLRDRVHGRRRPAISTSAQRFGNGTQ